MSRIRVQRQMFILGDFVFAKIHGYRHWPARVLGRYGTVSKLKYRVFFYGTCDTAMVPSSHVFDFMKNKRHLGGRHEKHTVRNADFRSAMAEILRAIARPENDFAYYQVLAQAKDEGKTCVPYEMLPPATESESETASEEEDCEGFGRAGQRRADITHPK
ncbi:hepatoma-derived growth factor-like [Drosophila kikkawai]|uniref:Hepatoma-derived growth factor-like n=1 Tax=Drosophila kikkawai TaxID=30033 RepID=A0A6P4JM82_DROKI|nr:hepatoma-derived growth factor-like [Drosophila kikkawai]